MAGSLAHSLRLVNVHMVFVTSWAGSLTLEIPDTFVETRAEPPGAETPAHRVCQHWSKKLIARIRRVYRAPSESFIEKGNDLSTSVESRGHVLLFNFMFYYWSHAMPQVLIVCISFWIMQQVKKSCVYTMLGRHTQYQIQAIVSVNIKLHSWFQGNQAEFYQPTTCPIILKGTLFSFVFVIFVGFF